MPSSADSFTFVSANSPAYYIDGQLRAGRVEVCLEQMTGRVCDDDMWGYKDASVVCRQLGFSPYGKREEWK